MAKRFRHSAGFGKRIEYWIIGRMIKEGLDVYVPIVDDMGIDAVVRRANGSFTEVQIKARSDEVRDGNSGLFAAMKHDKRDNYWFVFYSERMDVTLIMTSKEFVSEARQNVTGKNAGKRTIQFGGKRKNSETGQREEYVLPRFQKYVANDFSRLVK